MHEHAESEQQLAFRKFIREKAPHFYIEIQHEVKCLVLCALVRIPLSKLS